jgi:hypothetical protein
MALPKSTAQHFTSCADYLQWPDDKCWELIDGPAHAMAPAPSISHQALVGQLFRQIDETLDGAPCRPFIAPLQRIIDKLPSDKKPTQPSPA